MSTNADYCESCGQKRIKSGLNILDLLKDFITNIFNLDGRLFRSIKHLWKPAFLAKEYIAGRRKSYVNPIRFFLVMLVLLFFLLNNNLNSEMFEKGSIMALSKVEHKNLAQSFDTTVCSILPDLDVAVKDELRKKMFPRAEENTSKIWVQGTFMGMDMKEYEVTRYDAYSMTSDSLFAKYNLIICLINT